MMINTISETVKNLVTYCENEGTEVDEKTIKSWIMDILEDLSKEDITTVSYYLLRNEKNKENLLKVYSFVNARFEEKMSN